MEFTLYLKGPDHHAAPSVPHRRRGSSLHVTLSQPDHLAVSGDRHEEACPPRPSHRWEYNITMNHGSGLDFYGLEYGPVFESNNELSGPYKAGNNLAS